MDDNVMDRVLVSLTIYVISYNKRCKSESAKFDFRAEIIAL